jgi:hypothetical protein
VSLKALFNSLLVAGENVALASVAFLMFVFPRFTRIGGTLCLLIIVVLVFDAGLVVLDLFRSSGTRIRAVIAVLLWLPIAFLFLMMMQWEGPLYAAAEGNPPVFEVRGLSGICGVDVYSPVRGNAEWRDNNRRPLWSIHATARFAFEARFKYGEVPPGFQQITPGGNSSPPALDPNVTYRLVLGRCMGGPQYLSLHGDSISKYIAR